jgi:DNA-binding NarL/FixJ family response regulator
LEASTVRVLVVDDFEPFRRFVGSTLAKMQNLTVIGEASDGLEAVRKAEALKPDLIVLDIGLPTLNGIEVARQIRKSCPECKILFMSQESSAAVAQEAFSLGAMGYVVKANAGSELSAAVEAVCRGGRFVSKQLSGHNWSGIPSTQASSHIFDQEVLPPLAEKVPEMTHTHEVQFYSDEAACLSGFSCFIEAALKAEKPVIFVATESHRKSLLQELLARGVDTAAAIEQGLLVPVDVHRALSTFMVNDLPDPVRFQKGFDDVIASASKAAKEQPARVAACGEFAPTLWAQGKADAAVQVEHLTDEIAKTRNVDILCAYVLNNFQRGEGHVYERICTEHTAVGSR